MTRKLNPDRVRRHMALSTPDEIRHHFDRISSNYEKEVVGWVDVFRNRMFIKHQGPVEIQVLADEEGGHYIGHVLFIARVIPREKS